LLILLWWFVLQLLLPGTSSIFQMFAHVYSSPSGVLTRGLSWRSVRQPATAVVSF